MTTTKTLDQLERLAADYDAQAAAIRTTIAILTAATTTTQRGRLPATLRAAAAVDRARRNGHAADVPGKLRKKALSRFVLATVESTPRTIGELVAALRSTGHPIANANGLTGALNKWVHSGYLNRTRNGSYALTAKGSKRLRLLTEEMEPPASNQ